MANRRATWAGRASRDQSGSPPSTQIDNALCEALYESEPDGLLFPYVSLGRPARAEGSCESDGAATSALAFYDGASYPDSYAGALFFGDSARRCIWVMSAGADGLPDPESVTEFLVGAAAGRPAGRSGRRAVLRGHRCRGDPAHYLHRPMTQPMIRVVVLHPRDLAAPTLGGIQTFLHDFVKHSPADFDITVAGVTQDPDERPIGKRSRVRIGGTRGLAAAACAGRLGWAAIP